MTFEYLNLSKPYKMRDREMIFVFTEKNSEIYSTSILYIVILFLVVKLDDLHHLFPLFRMFSRDAYETYGSYGRQANIPLSKLNRAITESGPTFGQLRTISPLVNWPHLSGQFQKIREERDKASLIHISGSFAVIDERMQLLLAVQNYYGIGSLIVVARYWARHCYE